ncbi:MAG: YhcH/YjgK/YiaL family protein [Acidobacteriota bacterium]
MVIDRIAHASLYASLGPRVALALDYLQNTDVAALAPGTYELDGRRVYAMVQEYTTRLREQASWEAHSRYADLQFVARGVELMGYGPMTRFEQQSYDADKDYMALSGSGEFVTLEAGSFVLLWPGEGHMPGIVAEQPTTVKKIVIKIEVDHR